MIELLFAIFQHYYDVRVPPRYRHETDAAKDERIHNVPVAIDEACRVNPLQASLGWTHASCMALAATVVQWESGLLEDVHSGAKLGPARERCLFQIHRKALAVPDPKYRISKEQWDSLTGTDLAATTRCADAGVKILAWHVHRCRIKYEGGGWVAASLIFAEYHRPSVVCRAVLTPMSSRRGVSYATLLKKLVYHSP